MKLLIPTRNRPGSLAGVLRFLGEFYPGTSVTVADGSLPEHKAAVEGVTKNAQSINAEFKSYPYETPFYDRVLDVLENETEEFIVMGADDDYPFLDALAPAEGFLKNNSDYVMAIGMMLVMEINSQAEIYVHLRSVRNIQAPLPSARAANFASWEFPLSYALCRRDVLINRYRRSQNCGIGEMFDLLGGLHDCLQGKIRAIPQISLILTRNVGNEYARVKSKLEFFDRGAEIAAMIREFASDYREACGSTAEEALHQSSQMFGRRVGSYLTGIPMHLQPQFKRKPWLKDKFTRDQYEYFDRVFQPDTIEHAQYKDRLRYITKELIGQLATARQ